VLLLRRYQSDLNLTRVYTDVARVRMDVVHLYDTAVYASHTSHPPFSRPQQDQESLAWASTLSAAMPNQLAFALEPPKYAGPQGIAAFGRFARSIEALKPLVLQDLAGAMLAVAVNSSTGPVLGKIYLQQATAGMPAANRSWCAVLVVINGQNSPAHFRAEIGGGGGGSSMAVQQRPTLASSGSGNSSSSSTAAAGGAVPDYVTTAFTMLPFNSYSVALSNATTPGGPRALEDMVSRQHYAICERVPPAFAFWLWSHCLGT
jgi:hypothetical protein